MHHPLLKGPLGERFGRVFENPEIFLKYFLGAEMAARAPLHPSVDGRRTTSAKTGGAG
jgi:hypothetical protein